MDSSIENRQHPRVPISVPVVMSTPQGSIKGETGNLSIGGALILSPEIPESEDEFQMTIIFAENNEISVTCEKVWASTFDTNGSIHVGMGVRFKGLSSANYEIIGSQVSEYQL